MLWGNKKMKKIQIIIIISILLILSNFVGISNAKNPLTNQSLKALAYYPESHDFEDMKKGEANSTTFDIWNAGCCYLYFDLHENEEWIEVNPIEGGSTGEHVIITVTVNTTNLTFGLHKSNISIISNGGQGNFTVTVNVISDIPVIDITVGEAWNLLSDTSNGIQIPIDVRTEEEWKTEHIDTPSPENPRHHNYLEWSDPNILQEFISTYDGQQIIVICGVGGRSKIAANILAENNFNGVIYNMLGGLKEWKNQGYPTDGYTTFEIMNFQGGFGTISIDIKNNGSFTAKNITIEINVIGGFFSNIDFTSSCINCPVPLAPNATETESTRKDGFIIGFGPIEITVSAMAGNADKITIKQEGYIFGVLVLIK
jgi:rhodanese-related sulfurtransferase